MFRNVGILLFLHLRTLAMVEELPKIMKDIDRILGTSVCSY